MYLKVYYDVARILTGKLVPYMSTHLQPGKQSEIETIILAERTVWIICVFLNSIIKSHCVKYK